MASLAAIRASNAAFAPSYNPVAVFVGGTAGIGQGMVEAFGNYIKGKGHIIIIGRNRTAAESILAKFPKSTLPNISHEFIQCDATLMKNVHKVTSEILQRVPKINYLVMTSGVISISREETEEGIPSSAALFYYARWKFIYDLLPALKQAKSDGEDAKVLSVFTAGKGGPIDVNDFSFKKTPWTRVRSVAATHSDMMVEEFASRNPDLTFIHAFPGFVATNILDHSPDLILRAYSKISGAIKMVAGALGSSNSRTVHTQEECAEYMWYGTFSSPKGALLIGEYGDDLGKNEYAQDEVTRKKLWDYTYNLVNIQA